MNKLHVKKSDTVVLISGNEKGKKGRILKVFPKEMRVIVEGMNFVKRHLKKGHPKAQQGGIIQKESPVHISRVMLFCVKCNNPTRISYRILAEGEKVRVCKKCNEIIDKI